MSIYASWEDIGENEYGLDGSVLQYQRSHVFPNPEHPRASFGIASIPEWCIPGSDSEYEGEAVARYLRLDIQETGHMTTSTVILTEPAARKLHKQLSEWLALEKRDPTSDGDTTA